MGAGLVLGGLFYAFLPMSGLPPVPVLAASAQQNVYMQPHKAIYHFRLLGTTSGTTLNGLDGKMYFEIDDTCDAYTTEHRFSTTYDYQERAPFVTQSHYVAYEGKNDRQFSFSSEDRENGEVAELLRGYVDPLADGTARAVYARPEEKEFHLPKGYLLPTAFTEALIRAAAGGQKFFTAVIFDGADADGPMHVNAFIERNLAKEEINNMFSARKNVDRQLLTGEAWHVRAAVFPLEGEDTMTPSYEMKIIQQANGVISHAVIDYGTFQVEQSLQALEAVPQRRCP